MRFGFMMVAALMGAPVAAQDLPPLSEVVAEIDGREVQVNGIVRNALQGALFTIHLEDGETFAMTAALSRESLARLIECTEVEPCNAQVSAEISVEGPDINLIAYEISLE